MVAALRGQAASAPALTAPCCRGCGAGLATTFIDLGSAPPSNAYLEPAGLHAVESYYPLHAYVCDACFLVQLEAFQTPAEIFSDYAYFSSYSDSWLEHGARFADDICRSERLHSRSLVLEIASNDGYLLRHFAARGIRVAGIEPAANVARVAVAAGIPTITGFFGVACARELLATGLVPDLLVANNVLAHVPDLHDFVAGLAMVLGPASLATIEFPHLLQLMRQAQFDTIYHEHFSYFSLLSVEPVLARYGLAVVDVEQLPTHGGSLRLHVRHAGCAPSGPRVEALRALEAADGLGDLATYAAFTVRAVTVKRGVLQFLLTAQAEGKTVAAYGAPAKGNTFLGYCGIRSDLVAFTVDRSPHKQGRYLPGSHIPIYAPEVLLERRPDYVLILPWNIAAEVTVQMSGIRAWGGRFVTAIPELTVHK